MARARSDDPAPLVPKTAIPVTRPYLPPLAEYVAYLEGVWERNQLTNSGPLVLELEHQLRDYLGVRHVFFVANGTIALQVAIKALGLTGDVITTPFSYVATTSSLVWEGCTPVFGDIEPDHLTLDPRSIERVCTPRTTGVVATHVYGNPCDVDAIAEVARARGLRVLYDAAHAFGVRYQGKPICEYGDISTLSFHATKLFHTVEGGAVVTSDDALAHRISYLRNFGHDGPERFFGLGINGKNSEFHAAMGLCLLPRMSDIIASRAEICRHYDRLLSGITRPAIRSGTDYNYSYYPILLPSEEDVVSAKTRLEERRIYPRRYFYPSLTKLPYLAPPSTAPVGDEVARRVLCLPLYVGLSGHDCERIADALLG